MDDETKAPEPVSEPVTPPATPLPSTPPPAVPKKRRLWLLVVIILVIVLLGAGAYWLLKPDNKKPTTSSNQSSVKSNTAATQTVEGLELDPNKNYGNKYADGILPVGDNQYTTDAAAKGKVYVCNANFVPAGQAGAQTRGPWFIGTTKWDINKKVAVSGEVSWDHVFSNKIESGKRVISTNDLPNHFTGEFPVKSTDTAYAYDRNPNTIKNQSLIYTLTANPTYGSPHCMGGEVGVMLTGVALFNAFDAGGRDAGAWEVQDGCEGHPQSSGVYHYHTLSDCITDVEISTVIGFALDGFPITGPTVGDNNYLTTSDLDECHGITSDITLDGKKVKMYHYVMTQDFPYSVSCFRAEASESPAQHSGGQPAPPSGSQTRPRP